MPNKKISQLPKLHAPEKRDFLPVVEISDGLNKAIELSALGDFSGNYNVDRDGTRILLTNQNSNQIVLSAASPFLAGLMSAQDKANLTLALSALSANGFFGAGGYDPAIQIDYIVAAGGGGAGGTYYDQYGGSSGYYWWATSGGGGAGGIKTGTLTTVAPGYSIDFQVGAGGTGGAITGTVPLSTIMAARGGQGGTSRIIVEGTTLVTTVGGGGAGSSQNPDGQTGGSGGGGGQFFNGQNSDPLATGSGVGGSGTAGQGNAGGAGYSSSQYTLYSYSSYTGGGGGGVASSGAVGTNTGVGGLSATYWTTMSHPISVELMLGRGGNGFGASSSANNTGNGASGRVANTSSSAGIAGQTGGSGVIWVRYLKTLSPSVKLLGASVVDTTTNRQLSSYWVHKFTETTGAITF